VALSQLHALQYAGDVILPRWKSRPRYPNKNYDAVKHSGIETDERMNVWREVAVNDEFALQRFYAKLDESLNWDTITKVETYCG
jgi:hypothetical protein